MSRIEQFKKRAEEVRQRLPASALEAPELRRTLDRFKLDRRLNQDTSDQYVGTFSSEVSGLNGEGAYARALKLVQETAQYAKVGGQTFQHKVNAPTEDNGNGQIILDERNHAILEEYVEFKLNQTRNGNSAAKPDTNGRTRR